MRRFYVLLTSIQEVRALFFDRLKVAFTQL